MISARMSPLALAVSSTLLVAACGGGGGSGSGAPAAAPAATNVTITPSLGRFSTACVVDIRTSSGDLLGTRPINANGSVTIGVVGYAGPIIAQVRGSDTCTYYDEARNTDQPFGAGQTLSAVVDTVRTELSINVLTNLAAARVLDGTRLASGKTETEIKQENATVQQMFQVGNMFAAPTLIGSSTDRFDNTEAGRLAAKLAALAELARTANQQITEFSTALANDLKDDGNLNTVAIDAAALRTALQTAVDKYADLDAKPALDTLDDNTTLTTKVSDVQSDVAKVLAAGSALTQAKQIFADLRASIMSMSNDAGTGGLDRQNALLKADFQNGVGALQAIGNLSLMVDAVDRIFLGSAAGVSNDDSYCNRTGPAEIVCELSSSTTAADYRVVLTAVNSTRVAWNVVEARDFITGATPITGMTGTMSRDTSGRTTLAGSFYPMTVDGATTAVDVGFTHSGAAGSQVWSGSGSLNTLKADGSTSTLKVVVTEFSANEALLSARLVGSLSGPHHRFDGTLSFSEEVSSGTESEPKNGTLVGSFTDISNPVAPFKFLEGTLTASQNWTGFNPLLADSASNYAKLTVTFDGTAYKSAGVTGLGLYLTVNNNAGFQQEAGEFSFKGSNGVIVTGTATATGSTNRWTLTNGNGITATYFSATRSGTINGADGSKLGDISSQRVTFIDGTFESLI